MMMTTQLVRHAQRRTMATALAEGARIASTAAGSASFGSQETARNRLGSQCNELRGQNGGIMAGAFLAASALCYSVNDDVASCSAATLDYHTQQQQQQPGCPGLRRRDLRRKRTRLLADRYEVESGQLLGEGAFGAVHPAKIINTNRRVALKSISKMGTDPVTFQREMDALRRIADGGGHPNICSLEDNFEDLNEYYLVFELVQGGELFDNLVDHGTFSEEDAQRAMREIASALEFLHGLGIVHADLKPENLLVSSKDRREGRMKMIDFGCAVVSSDNKPAEKAKDNSSGTIGYWSPERFASPTATPDSATDMWSLGVILYILLTGRHPFDTSGESTEEQIEDRIRADPRPPKSGMAHISPEAVDLIERLLETDPKERISAKEMLGHPWLKTIGPRF